MDVSVIIPLYNGARWIEDTIRSVQAQTQRPREIIVVDDGSQDESRAVVRSSFPAITLLQSPGNGGRGAGRARDYGLRHSSAPLVAFLDQDDLWHPSHLRVATRLLEDPAFSAAITGLERFAAPSEPAYDAQECGADVREYGARTFSPWDRYPLNSIYSPSCVVVRRSALQDIGGWPHRFVISDLHAWLKLAAVAPMVRTDRVTVGKRTHDCSALHTLRAEKAISFARDYTHVCDDALAFRARTHPGSPIAFRERLDTFQAMRGVLEGAITPDAALLTRSARFLSQDRNAEPGMDAALWEMAFWMLRDHLCAANAGEQRRILGRLVRGWPREGRAASAALPRLLTQILSYRTFLSCGARNPIRAATSPLFLTCMRRQLGKTAKRAARFLS